jgi:MOSC domain-containing protein
VGEVVWLCRYPVKSMRGETLELAEVDHSGVRGDRRFAVLDCQTGLVASAKNPAKWAGLLDMGACVVGDGVEVTLPDGDIVSSDAPAVDKSLSNALGRSVTLIGQRPPDATLERLTPEGDPGAGVITRGRVAPGGEPDKFVDFGAIHMVTTATLDQLGSADPRRFRPNAVIRMFDDTPFVENSWPGRRMTIGSEVKMVGVVPTPRCVVPTVAQGSDVPEDREVMRRAARQNRIPVLDLGRLTCVGAYTSVERAGQIRLGDVVMVA